MDKPHRVSTFVRDAIVVVTAVIAGGSIAGAQVIDWNNDAGGNWSVPTNWSPVNVPDTAGESAVISLAGAYAVSVDLSPTIDGLFLTNPNATITINAGQTLGLLGPGSTNDGLIQLNPQASSTNAVLSLVGSTTLGGVGEIWLRTSADNSQITTGPGAVLTNGPDHKIGGVGQIPAALVNEGTIRADAGVSVAGSALELLGSDKTNNGVMSALVNAVLDISGTTITQGAGGRIIAQDGGEIRLSDGAGIVGGTLESVDSGFARTWTGNVTLRNVSNLGSLILRPSATTAVSGVGLVNNGIVQVNPEASSANAVLRFDETGALSGTGEVQMRTWHDNSQVTTAVDVTLTNGPAHLIRGVGWLTAALVNNGEIRADVSVSVSGNGLDLFGQNMLNNNLMVAVADSFLDITGITVTQGPGGVIRADQGTVRTRNGATLIGGTCEAINGGSFATFGGTTALTGITNSTPWQLVAGNTIAINGSGITNNDVMQVNSQASSSNTVLRFDESGTLDGTGEIQLRTRGDNSQVTTGAGAILTHASSHLIRGVGWLTAALVNNGEIRADVSVSVAGNELDVFGEGKVNNALMSAAAGSFLDITTTTITQGPGGVIRADDGTVRTGSDAVIVGGTLDASPAGSFSTLGGTTTLTDTINLAPWQLVAGNTIVVRGTGLTNNGVVQVNSQASSANAVFSFDQDGTLDGSGEIQLRTRADNSQITTADGVTVIHGASHLIRGVGYVTAAMVNNGEIRADASVSVSGNDLDIIGHDKTNNSLMSAAVGSSLDITGLTLTQGGAGIIRADGGTVRIGNGAVIVGGTLEAADGGSFSTLGATATLTGVTNQAPWSLNAGNVIAVRGAGLINDALIEVNPQHSSADAVLRFDETGTLGGTGEVRLLTSGGNARVATAPGATLIHGVNHVISGTGQVNAAMTNQGTIIADAASPLTINPAAPGVINNGTLQASGPGGMVINNGGMFTNQNLVLIDAGSALTVNGGYSQENGTTTVDGMLTVTAGSANIRGGLFQGSGTVNGTLNNVAGTVSPGQGVGARALPMSPPFPGILTVDNYVQTEEAITNIDIGGLEAGSGHDGLTVRGTANLAGTLNIKLINDFVPQLGDTFRVVEYGELIGAFCNLTGLSIPGGLFFDRVYDLNGLRLVVVSVQPNLDCDGSGTGDDCDIASGASADCNLNTVPDRCDVALGTSVDCNGNGIPDECELGACCLAPTQCAIAIEADCIQLGGAFRGPCKDCPTQNVAVIPEPGGEIFVHVIGPPVACPGDGLQRAAACPEGKLLIDPWESPADGQMCHNFGVEGSPAIPADFFADGSEPFIGAVCLTGVPLGPTEFGEFGDADTLIGRTEDPFDRCEFPSTTERTVSLDVVALSLQNVGPVTITVNGEPEEWDVKVDLSEVIPPSGSLTAVKSYCNGGTYTSILNVQPRFTFTKATQPQEVRVLDTGLAGIDPVQLTQDVPAPWVSVIDPELGVTGDLCSDFHAGIEESEPRSNCDCNTNLEHDVCDAIGWGDFDGNGRVDLDDFSAFANCMAEPGETPIPPSPECLQICLDAFDFDADADVDFRDFARFQLAFDGE